MFILAVALFLGLLSSLLMKRIGLPNVTGYLIVGLAIGPFAAKIIPSETMLGTLGIINTVALGFIAFSIGVEFKLQHIREIGKSAITITLFQALSATLFVDIALLATGFFTGMPAYEAIVLGAIATATAPAATLMVVRQYRAKGIVTQTLLPVVALDDAVGLVVFSVCNSIALSLATGSGSISVVNVLVWPLAEIVASVAIGAGIGFLLSFLPKLFRDRDSRLICNIFSVFLCLGFCKWFSSLKEAGTLPFALSDLLGCMMCGAVFVNVREEAEEMMHTTDAWTPVVFMLFFILSGAELDVSSFLNDGMLLICIFIYVVARAAGKYCGTLFGATVTHADPNVRKYLGITLLPQAGVAIGMATKCLQEFTAIGMAEIGHKFVTITMCAVLIYELIGPVLTKTALAKAGEIAPEMLQKKHGHPQPPQA